MAINGDAAPGDQAKVAVLGISLRRTMMEEGVYGKGIEASRGTGLKNQNQIPPLYKKLTMGGVQLRVNQVASWTWRDRGTRAKPNRGLAKTPPRLVARDINFSSSSRAADKQQSTSRTRLSFIPRAEHIRIRHIFAFG